MVIKSIQEIASGINRPCTRRLGSMLAVVVFAAGLGSEPAAARSAGETKLLLLPIVVHSAEDPEYLRGGLADMLTARFSRIGALKLIRPPAKNRGTTDLDEAVALGRKSGADYVLWGSFTRFGQGASLDVQCSPTDESRMQEPLREIFVHSGSIGDIIPDLDELAGKVSRFAMGEIVSPAAPASAGFAVASGSDTQALIGRIEALEAAIAALQDAAGGDESTGELR